MIEEEVPRKTLRCFAPCPLGHLTGGYVASPSATPKFAYGKLHISPERCAPCLGGVKDVERFISGKMGI